MQMQESTLLHAWRSTDSWGSKMGWGITQETQFFEQDLYIHQTWICNSFSLLDQNLKPLGRHTLFNSPASVYTPINGVSSSLTLWERKSTPLKLYLEFDWTLSRSKMHILRKHVLQNVSQHPSFKPSRFQVVFSKKNSMTTMNLED